MKYDIIIENVTALIIGGEKVDRYILSLDQGTTSSRAILFDENGKMVYKSQKEFKQIFIENGYVEHNPEDIWNSQIDVAKDAINGAKIDYKSIASISITNQRETTIVWDKKTGDPVYNAIVWQCRRTSEYCKELNLNGYEKMIKDKTGLIIDPYFSATKLKWILDNVDGVKQSAKNGDLLFGTVDTYLIWRLTDGRVHATDVSNASRTMLFNINTLEWDDEILSLFDIPKCMLPEVKDSSDDYGTTSIFGGEISINGVAGDQQASLFGQACFNKGELKCTYGTGAFMLINTGEKPVKSNNGLLTTIAWRINGVTCYALEGSIFVAGAAVQWLRDELKLIDTASQSEEVALSVKNSNGVYVVPAFVGLGAPYWNSDARGTISGLTRGSSSAHIVRATLESIAYQVYDVINLMESEARLKVKSLKVDGGACANNFLMQFQSDITSLDIKRPKCIETTALGSAYLAGLYKGLWTSTDKIRKIAELDYEFKPRIDNDKRNELLAGWKMAVKRTIY